MRYLEKDILNSVEVFFSFRDLSIVWDSAEVVIAKKWGY